MAIRYYGFTALTGGGTGALDKYPEALGPALGTDDLAFGLVSGIFYMYRFDATSVAPESSPLVIDPSGGSGKWLMKFMVDTDESLSADSDLRVPTQQAVKAYADALLHAINTLEFATSPTVGDFLEGKLYYDALWKTLAVQIDADVNLQIGQETVAYCKNVTVADILNGAVVYITGADAGYPTIDLADATDVNKAFVLGVCTKASIAASGGLGHVTIRGHANNIDTSLWPVGTSLYLSSTVPGALTSTPPSEGSYDVRVGRVMIQSATTGRVYVNVRPMYNLTDLGDVGDLTSKAVDDALVWNGTEWVNKSISTISAGKGVGMYLDGTNIIPVGNDNSNNVETLSKVPWDHAEDVEQTVVTAATSPILSDIYLDITPLGVTSLPAGTWTFISFSGVSRTQGVSEILGNLMRVRPYAGTVSMTNGADATHRIVTASEGTPFDAANLDVGGTRDSDSYLMTPKGVYQITTRTDNTHIIILVPSTYTNENTVAFSIHKRLFQITTGEMNNITGAAPYAELQKYTSQHTQTAAIVVEATDMLAAYRFAKTTDTSNNTISFAYGGTTRYSHIETPLAVLHNDLAGLNAGDYAHLSAAQKAIAIRAANTSQSGYLTDTDWNTFNGKANAIADQVNLSPGAAFAVNRVGAIRYDAANNAVFVCTSI